MLVNEKSNLWLTLVLIAVFALTRLPDMLPVNFSAAYALAFCAGVYLPRRAAWLLPLAAWLEMMTAVPASVRPLGLPSVRPSVPRWGRPSAPR